MDPVPFGTKFQYVVYFKSTLIWILLLCHFLALQYHFLFRIETCHWDIFGAEWPFVYGQNAKIAKTDCKCIDLDHIPLTCSCKALTAMVHMFGNERIFNSKY